MARRRKPITREDVADKLLAVYQRCMQEEQTKDGSKVDAKGALQALDQLSKLLGLGAAEGEGQVLLTLSEEAGEHGN